MPQTSSWGETLFAIGSRTIVERHHLHPHPRRLPVSCRRDRSVFAACCWPPLAVCTQTAAGQRVHARPHLHRPAAASAADGRLAAQTKDQSSGAFRSRLTIHQLRVARIPRTAQSDAKHEPPLGRFALQIACRAMVAGIVGIMRWRRASLTCSNANASAAESIKPAPKLARTCSPYGVCGQSRTGQWITSSFSTIHSANTLGTACCHR